MVNFYDGTDDQDDTTYTEEDDDKKHAAVQSPAVKDEENPMSGDASDSVSPDLDKALEDVGLQGDFDKHGNEDPKPLGMAGELMDDEQNQ